MTIENAIIVRSQTRLETLIKRFNSKAQTQFYIEHSGGQFADYEKEHDQFYRSLEAVQRKLSKWLKIKIIDREFLPNFIFSENDMVVVIGQDGLVANAAKYVKDRPIVAINPDSGRYDGVLLPFTPKNFEHAVLSVLNDQYAYKQVSMAQAQTNDGQKLLAFNDLFIGAESHVSARYHIEYQKVSERHSSSGIIVSTGAGSTGWLSSLFNMANGIFQTFARQNAPVFTKKGAKMPEPPPTQPLKNQRLEWDASKLIFVVREPFLSKHSRINLTAGIINQQNKLRLESYMPENGIIFSDGIEADYLQFNSGTIVHIGLAKEKANLVLNPLKKKPHKR